MNILVLVCLLVIFSCLATGDSTTTTTETATILPTLVEISEEEKETMKKGEELEDEKIKTKRTIERTLGYGYNDIASARLLREQDDKYRYYQQTPQVRYYTTLRNSVQPQVNNQQSYVASSPAPPVYNFQPSTQTDAESIYFTKPTYQQLPRYKGVPAGNPEHSTPLFTGPPPHAPAFFQTHNPFAHNLQTPFFPAANFHSNPLLYQNPGAGGLAFLQVPGHFGPQVIPVIILRINDVNSNQHLGGVPPAYLHGLQNLYPLQQPVFSEAQGHQQLFYQQGTSASPNQPVQQKVAYTASENKPLVPSPSSNQKLRKNAVVSSDEPTAQSESNYNQYSKVSFKGKA